MYFNYFRIFLKSENTVDGDVLLLDITKIHNLRAGPLSLWQVYISRLYFVGISFARDFRDLNLLLPWLWWCI